MLQSKSDINGRTAKQRRLIQKLGKELLVFDGAMGSMLHLKGILPGELPEVCNITHPDWIADIHATYLESGATCIITNTLGTNRYHFEDSQYSLEEIILAAVKNGREAICREEERCTTEGLSKESFLFFNIGPIGRLLAPMGTLSFEDAYEAFKEQVDIVKNLVDGVLIETMSDTYEIKAAVLAVKENSDLPVFACMTFGENGRTLTGATPEVEVALLEGLGVDCLGVNCSLGPKELVPVVEAVLAVARIPVIVEPNAGLPIYENNATRYNVTVEEFAEYIASFVRAGISCFGGCCGTTPEYIRRSCELISGTALSRREVPSSTCVTSGTQSVRIGERTVICGERLNPTGKKKLKEALLAHRLDDVFAEAISQEKAGAHVLDVNVGVPGIDEAALMVEVIRGLQEIIQLPLQIDSADPAVLEKACRIYNGKPLINSVNGKQEVMNAVFPIVKKYGGVVVALTLDESGIPESADKRMEIARNIIETAASFGIDKSDIIIDCLTLTVSAQQEGAEQTLEAVSRVRNELKMNTVLGLSNISFGLPNRPLINRTFLTMALNAGLSMPIMNPLDADLMSTIDAYEVLSAKDENSADYVARHAGDSGLTLLPKSDAARSLEVQSGDVPGEATIRSFVVSGRKERIAGAVRSELLNSDPMAIINNHLIPALNEVGKKYEQGILFLPQLILSAETAKIAFGELKGAISSSGNGRGKGPIVLATVEGDIHDIGKNIVKVILESYGYEVIDLGKDVPAAEVVKAFHTYHPKLIGLSALMTTTVVYMEKTIAALKQIPVICPIIVGGAVLTPDVARQIGADYYAKDAMETVGVAGKVISD
jgi:5-methyltetrahydrofolate--homocysteine methyltransferase